MSLRRSEVHGLTGQLIDKKINRELMSNYFGDTLLCVIEDVYSTIIHRLH